MLRGQEPRCPAAQPARPGTAQQVDYVDALVWKGQEYLAVPSTVPTERGEEVTTIACSIEQISKGGKLLVPTPWPDRTATRLPVGTVVHAVPGEPPSCLLTAEGRVFRAYAGPGVEAPGCAGR